MKYCKYIMLVLVVFLLVGCSKKTTKTCKMISDQSESGYKITTKYVINASGDIVNEVIQTDTVESDKKEILDFYKKEYESMYKKYNKTYGGYTYDIKTDKNKITCKVVINYKKFKRDKYINDNTGLKKFVNKKNYFTIDGITKMYQNIGATCK